MQTFKVKKPHDKRVHLATRQVNVTSYGKVCEVFEIIKPFNLGLYTRSELENVEQLN